MVLKLDGLTPEPFRSAIKDYASIPCESPQNLAARNFDPRVAYEGGKKLLNSAVAAGVLDPRTGSTFAGGIARDADPRGYARRVGCTAKDVDARQLKLGTQIEMEHTRDRRVARQIAKRLPSLRWTAWTVEMSSIVTKM